MKKIAVILFLFAAVSSCKKEAGDCYKCIPAANQVQYYDKDTVICEGHSLYSKAVDNNVTDDNAQQVNCKKMQ